MQLMISRMWVIVAVPEQWWMISILARLIRRPFLKGPSTLLQSNLNTTKTKLRSSSLSYCNFWFPCWYWDWLLAFATTQNLLEDSLPQNWKRFLQKLAHSLWTWICVLLVDVRHLAFSYFCCHHAPCWLSPFGNLLACYLARLFERSFALHWLVKVSDIQRLDQVPCVGAYNWNIMGEILLHSGRDPKRFMLFRYK